MKIQFSPIQQFLITWVLVLVTGWLTLSTLSYMRELVSILVTAGLIAFLLNYPVGRLAKVLPRGVAAGFVYLTAAFIVAIIGVTIVPPVFNQARQLGLRFPELLDSARHQLTLFQEWNQVHNLPVNVQILQQQLFEKLQTQVEAIATTSFGLVLGTFNWFIDLILILVISFYMLLDGERVWLNLTSIIDPKVRDVLTSSLQRNLQQFVFGQLLLGLFMAVTLTLGFWGLQVPFFLLFAVFIGFMELIPFIGATLGIGTVSLIVVFINGWLALKVLGIAILLQQIKDNGVAPRILGNLTGLSPVVIFAALLLGGKVAGLLGVILAIPLTGVVKSIVEVILDPDLPPQTGSLFYNPVAASREIELTQTEESVSE